jgi:hypothetical protein
MGRRVGISTLTIVALLSIAVGRAGAGEAREVHPSGIVKYHAVKGAGKPGRPGRNPNLSFHGGPIMTGAVVTPIYWGTSWSNASFVEDKISGLGTFYSGMSGSAYAGTNAEYTDGTATHVGTTVTYTGSILDTSAAPSKAPSTSTILGEVAAKISNPVPNGYYPVYVDTRRGSAGYCAWHSYGTISGVAVQFAFFFNLDGDAGCDPRDTWTSHSQGLGALANVSGHEISEAFTDPHLNAWYDAQGYENSDKCAWTFHAPVNFSGSTWKVQGNWSNAAYNANSGYANGGCIDGN